MGATEPRTCVDCGTPYCLYREDLHEWVCAECLEARDGE